MTGSKPLNLPVHKHSWRSGKRVRLVVLHTAEGASSVGSLAAFLNRPGIKASYHAAVDDRQLAQYVPYDRSAWHLRSGNPVADGLCLCGFAAWSRDEWLRHEQMLALAARWVAERCRARRVPLRLLTPAETGRAVRNPQHPGGAADHDRYTEGTGDGTHWDVGPEFPFDVVFDLARSGPTSSPRRKGLFMHLSKEQETTVAAMAEQYVNGQEGVRHAGVVRIEMLRTHQAVTEILELVRSLTERIEQLETTINEGGSRG